MALLFITRAFTRCAILAFELKIFHCILPRDGGGKCVKLSNKRVEQNVNCSGSRSERKLEGKALCLQSSGLANSDEIGLRRHDLVVTAIIYYLPSVDVDRMWSILEARNIH